MSNVALEFPPGFEDYESEFEAKGWLPGVVAVIEERRYTLTIYDPARLAQDVEAELKLGKVFFERNLIVVGSVTRQSIAAAMREIVQTGRVSELRPDDGQV